MGIFSFAFTTASQVRLLASACGRVLVAISSSVAVFSRFSGLLNHVKPQNAKMRAFENARINLMELSV